jgi:hypothetical protein
VGKVDDPKNENPANGDEGNFVPWLFAMAEDEGAEKKWNPKRMGEVSQAAFLLKAQRLGYGVAVPWGDSEKSDFIVWARRGGRLLRVQVKGTGRLYRGGYDIQPVYSTRDEGKKRYTAEDIDVLVAHIVIEAVLDGEGKEVWYVVPVAAIAGVKSMRFYPEGKSRCPRWEKYREAWKWLGRGKGGR